MNARRFVRTLTATIAIAAIALIAGCARIPLTGPVMEGQEIEDAETQGVLFYPNPPAPGDTQDEIVRGFLEAGTGTQSNYSTARSYLVDELAATWDPTARVLVHKGAATFTIVDDTHVEVTIEVVAEVDDSGQFVSYETPQKRTLEMTLRQVDGEWRVSEAEPGLVLMAERFEQVFEPFTLYFFDSTYHYLVPDVRWFPKHSTAPTRIVQALLGGPANWLTHGAVRSAFPGDVTLRGPVTVEAGIAQADFSSDISLASNDMFSLMLLQLRESLRGIGIGNIDDVEMSANGAELDVTLPPEGAVHAHPQVNATPLVLRDGELGYLSGDTLTPPTGSERLASMLGNMDVLRGTISAEQGLGAFLTDTGLMAIPYSTGQPVAIDSRDGVVAPSIDPFGYVWTASSLEGGVRVTDIMRYDNTTFDLGDYGSEGVLSLQVGRDSARLAALVRDDGKVRLIVASIERSDGAGEPSGIGEPIEIPITGSGTPKELTWVDETSVALLIDDGKGTTSVQVRRIGGESTEYGAIEDGAQIAGSNTRAGLRLVDAGGNLYVWRTSRWTAQGTRIDVLITQA